MGDTIDRMENLSNEDLYRFAAEICVLFHSAGLSFDLQNKLQVEV